MADDRDLHRPAGPASAVAVLLHPHPGMGGDRHHPLMVELAERLSAAGVAALRLDLRHPDVDAAATRLAQETVALVEELQAPRAVLVGYSWGAAVVAGAQPASATAKVLVAPPVTMLDLAPSELPVLALVPAHDQYGPPPAVEAALAGWPNATVEVVEGCDHFLAGAVGRIADRAVGWLTDLD